MDVHDAVKSTIKEDVAAETCGRTCVGEIVSVSFFCDMSRIHKDDVRSSPTT